MTHGSLMEKEGLQCAPFKAFMPNIHGHHQEGEELCVLGTKLPGRNLNRGETLFSEKPLSNFSTRTLRVT